MAQQFLQGGCNCGRNRYTVQLPPNASEHAQVFFDNSDSHRRAHASPLSAYLHVPLAWVHTTTYAFFDDETHTTIRRVYSSPSEQTAKRHFCGYCGTPLSYWSESPSEEAEYISITLGSLIGKDLRDLEELGLVPDESVEGGVVDRRDADGTVARQYEGVPWFESLIGGSDLGRMKHRKGQGQSADGRTRVEWEVVEWIEGDALPEDSALSGAKRKLEASDADDIMDGLH